VAYEFSSSPEVRRRKRHRLLLVVGIIAIAIIAVPLAWVGTLMTSYLARMKTGEHLTLADVRKKTSVLADTSDVSKDALPSDLDRLVPDTSVPELGNRNARLTLVAFMDYECSHSADFASALRRVMETEKGDVRLVIRDFPVIDAAASRISANAARCVLDQGQEKYWRFFDQLFADQSKRTREDFLTFAKIAGADVTAFDKCFSSRPYDLAIDESLAFGKKVGVSGTPTTFVNRVRIEGAMSEEMLRRLIDRAKEALPK
jgi:protein-disulfide isomerase